MAESEGRVFIIDEMVPHPGSGEDFLSMYMEKYAPGAKQRGMHLEHVWVSPPLWLREQCNTVFVVWSMADAQAVWNKNFVGRLDDSMVSWWQEAATRVRRRERHVVNEAGQLAALSRTAPT